MEANQDKAPLKAEKNEIILVLVIGDDRDHNEHISLYCYDKTVINRICCLFSEVLASKIFTASTICRENTTL